MDSFNEIEPFIRQISPKTKYIIAEKNSSNFIRFQTLNEKHESEIIEFEKCSFRVNLYKSDYGTFEPKCQGIRLGNLFADTNWLDKYKLIKAYLKQPPQEYNENLKKEIQHKMHQISPEFINDVYNLNNEQTNKNHSST